MSTSPELLQSCLHGSVLGMVGVEDGEMLGASPAKTSLNQVRKPVSPFVRRLVSLRFSPFSICTVRVGAAFLSDAGASGQLCTPGCCGHSEWKRQHGSAWGSLPNI